MKTIAIAALTLAFAAPSLALAQAPTRAELARVDRILRNTPLIDGHNDLPEQIHDNYGGDLSRVDLTADTRTLSTPLHTDIPRLRQGMVGPDVKVLKIGGQSIMDRGREALPGDQAGDAHSGMAAVDNAEQAGGKSSAGPDGDGIGRFCIGGAPTESR